MTTTIVAAQIYSMNKGQDMGFEVEYSEGTRVRAVRQPGAIIRTEAFIAGAWKMTQKPYVVTHSKKRNGERIEQAAKDFIAA